jgi:hypothetical protein
MSFGIGYAVFFYVAHFTLVQSVLLSVVGLFVIDGYRLAFRTVENQQPSSSHCGFPLNRIGIRYAPIMDWPLVRNGRSLKKSARPLPHSTACSATA